MHDNDISEALQSRVLSSLESGLKLVIRGGGSKNFYGNTVTAAESLELSPHQGIVAYEPTELAITVRAGTPLSTLEKRLAENGQMIPFDPPDFTGQATIGGAVATGLSGPRRPYTGSVRDALLGVKIINGHGQILEFGGRVMKNVAGYDLSRLMAGAMGTLGVLLEVSFKLRPLPACEKTLSWKMDVKPALQQLQRWHQNPANYSATAYDGENLYLRISGDEQSVDRTIRSMDGSLLKQPESFWCALKNHQHPWFNLETSVGSRKSTQSIDAPGETEKVLITNQVTTDFYVPPCTPMAYASSSRPTEVSRFKDSRSIWRISTKPSVPLPFPNAEYLLEWAGGIRWLKTDLEAEEIRQVVAKNGGHAILFKANNDSAVQIERFQPLNPALFQLHKNVKNSLDPQGIFNPGRLYTNL